MIFYFSGTGNSLYAAEKLAAGKEEIISIADILHGGQTEYQVEDGESVGFVFPVYFYTLSDVMIDFIDRLVLKNAGYVYAVITCGGGIGGCGKVLQKHLAKHGIRLSAVYSLLMPDNAMIYYNVSTKEEALDILKKADIEIDKIRTAVENHTCTKIRGSLLTPLMRNMYHLNQSTAKFYVTDACISCGICEKYCPDQAVRLVDGHPVWVKNTCIKCTSCINRCPKQAIQYTKRTEKRNRYSNPFV